MVCPTKGLCEWLSTVNLPCSSAKTADPRAPNGCMAFAQSAQICCSTLPSLVTSLCSSRIICTESVADIATIIVFTPYSTVTNY